MFVHKRPYLSFLKSNVLRYGSGLGLVNLCRFNVIEGKPETGKLSQVPGLGRQVSGSGVQHQVQVGSAPVPVPGDPYLIPDQPRPET